MAINTAARRKSCIGLALLFLRTGAIPDASNLSAPQRLHTQGLYSGIAASTGLPAPAPIQMSLCDWDWGKTMAVDTYHGLDWGTLDAIGATPLQVDASTTLLYKGAIFRADPGNAQTLYLGGATVTPGTTPATDGISLSAGESITLPIDQLSRIYVVAPSGSNKLQFLGI